MYTKKVVYVLCYSQQRNISTHKLATVRTPWNIKIELFNGDDEYLERRGVTYIKDYNDANMYKYSADALI